MTQDDQQPDGSARPGISRDTLLLLGALTFLILAVALTFLFTPDNELPTEPTSPATSIAGELLTPTSGGPYPSPGGQEPYPSPGGQEPYPSPGGQEPYPVATSGGVAPTVGTYPGPVGEEVSPSPDEPGTIPTGLAEPTPSDGMSPEPTATDGAAGGQLPTATDAAYPGPVGEGTPPALPTFNPTVIQPTTAPPAFPTTAPPPALPTTAPPPAQPTTAPPPTEEPIEEPTEEPTDELALDETPTPLVVPTLPAARPPDADVLRGNVRWAAGQSPIILKRDVQIAPGAELVIEPGVEVRLDPGVSIYVDGGRLLAMGLPDRPVRFVGNTGARWSGLFGQPGSFVVLENTEVRGGGAGGTVMAIDRSELIVRSSRFQDNGGSLLVTDTKLEMLNSEVSGNDMPFGAALEARYARGNFVTLRGNRFGGNRLSDGAPQVRFANSSTFDTLNLAIEGNLMRGGAPNLQLATNGPLKGTVTCNTLIGDAQGFGLRTQTPQVDPNGVPPMDLLVENNYMDEHVPPIVPVYLKYGLGRGATSEILLDMRNNWWGDPSGPYEPDENADGRGDSVGENIIFAPWLTAPPSCSPSQ